MEFEYDTIKAFSSATVFDSYATIETLIEHTFFVFGPFSHEAS